jgi:hypothetical protein
MSRMRACLLVGGALALVGGCAHRTSTVEARPSTREAVVDTRVPAEVTKFRDGAYSLATEHDDPMHKRSIAVMRDMSAALKSLPGDTTAAANEIVGYADALAASHPDQLHSGRTKAALTAAVNGLGTVQSQHPAFPARLEAARQTVARIDTTRPFLAQEQLIDAAFVDVANAMLLMYRTSSQDVEMSATTHQMRSNRWLFDQVGGKTRVEELCGSAGAAEVKYVRNSGDVAAALFTHGIYTPIHIKVTCRTIRTAQGVGSPTRF